jgi:hypothetical protein
MRVKMNQIRYFLALCDEQSFTRAARRCGIAQPSLTRAIQELENECNGRLFDRNQSSIELTELGMLVKSDFARIDQVLADVASKVAEFNTPPQTKTGPEPKEAFMRALAVTVLTIAFVATGLALRSTPSATEPLSSQISPYALQSTVEMKTLPEQNSENLF